MLFLSSQTMKKTLLCTLLLVITSTVVTAQENRLGNQPTSSGAIYDKIEKLGFLGSALFIAAHPDDENTRLISWLENDKKARTAYLSLTRGDGGQNLIGPQLREQLGMIRTQELLEARHIDGGEQFFTRANDFGYSKNPKETLSIWNKQEVLSDVVRAIRSFKPDVVINRFDHRSPGTTHGHHTSSAILSVEAFDLVNDPTAFPQQLNQLTLWQPQRLFFNTSWWFYGSEDAFAKADKTNLYEVKSGGYFASTGYSNGEIAALSRSKHKSQGFGSRGSRGNAVEYLEFLKGTRPEDKNDIFEGINTTWSRIDSSGKVAVLWEQLLDNYDFKQPHNSLTNLIELQEEIKKLPSSYWQKIKLEEIHELVLDLAGIYLNATTNLPYATAGEKIALNIEVTNRALKRLPFTIKTTPFINMTENASAVLEKNSSQTLKAQLVVPSNQKPTSPYYLEKPGTLGMYKVDDTQLIGMAEADNPFTVTIELSINSTLFTYQVPVRYSTTDPVRGELFEPFHVVPAVSLSIENPVYIFTNSQIKTIDASVKAYQNTKGSLKVQLPDGWSLKNEIDQLISLKKGENFIANLEVIAPNQSSKGTIELSFVSDDQSFDQEVIHIDYQHIPNQQLLRPASALLVNPGLKNNANRVAYIKGAGDDVAAALEAIGTQVDQFEPSSVPTNLALYDAVMVGIRAYNIAPQELSNLQPTIRDYITNGGTFIMQYNTNRGIFSDALGPLDISLSRKRVTDENAVVTFLQPKHEIINKPNQITTSDFDNWVQERGLYFPDNWDPAFTPILGMNDPGEPITKGSLIVAKYGKGHIIYTGLSLFRELPAGVTGAYKLLANMISLGKN